MRSWIFSIITPVFRVTWSSESLSYFCCSRYISLCDENSCAASYFRGSHDTFLFSRFFDEQKVQKNSMYCNIMNIITVACGLCWIKVLWLDYNMLKVMTWSLVHYTWSAVLIRLVLGCRSRLSCCHKLVDESIFVCVSADSTNITWWSQSVGLIFCLSAGKEEKDMACYLTYFSCVLAVGMLSGVRFSFRSNE